MTQIPRQPPVDLHLHAEGMRAALHFIKALVSRPRRPWQPRLVAPQPPRRPAATLRIVRTEDAHPTPSHGGPRQDR